MALFRHYVSGLRRYSEKAFKHPLLALQYLLYGTRKAAQLQVRRVVEGLGYKAKDVDKYYDNLEYSKFRSHVLRAASPFTGVGSAGEDFYVFLRMIKPEIVIETGVFAGVSSAFILKALEDNNKGLLYSIDYPLSEQEYAAALASGLESPAPLLPEGKEPGFAIPENVKGRWVFKKGKSKEILPNLLKELGKVDVFLHDSQHTYENMIFEYSSAWDYLTEGGLLLSHDIAANSAFDDFSKKVRRKPFDIYFRGGVGVIIK